jgi:hypothetical protein
MALAGGYGVGEQGPQVTIRQIKRDAVDFVLSNVDLAYGPQKSLDERVWRRG